jgi:transposase
MGEAADQKRSRGISVGAIMAGTLLAEVGDPHRFPTGDHFVSYCGTEPVERRSGPNTRMQINPDGNRRLNGHYT